MVKVSSFWYKDGDGKAFHAIDKPMLNHVFSGVDGFNVLKMLIIKPEWLDTRGEALLPSMILVGNVRMDFIRAVPRLLRGVKFINRLAVTKLADYLFILHKTDDMYYERFGYLIGRAIERYPEWRELDINGRLNIIREERNLYFTHEKREDRLIQLNNAWGYLEAKYVNEDWIRNSINFIMDSIYSHRELYNKDEVSRLGMKAFHPENWYPAGRGQLWHMIHGGKG